MTETLQNTKEVACMKNKFRYIAAGLALALGLAGCSGGAEPVQVERVDRLSAAAAAQERFAGVVISEDAVEVARELDMVIDEVHVKAGDSVKKGQKLFSYDSDDLNLNLDKLELEQDRLEKEIKDLKATITEKEKTIKEKKQKKEDTTLDEMDLRSCEMDLTQKEFDEDALKLEISNTKKMLKNVNVTAPVTGTVRAINQDSYDAYIVIQEPGAFRVKGLLNEMNMGMGIMEGTPVQIVSRLDPGITWNGTVELVDYENTESNSYDEMYYGYADSMTTTSNYPFYISLDSTEGLLLGQHVYIQMAPADVSVTGLVSIPEDYLMDLLYSDETGLITANVWVVNEEYRLEKRAVTLGDYDMNTGSYYVLEGLGESDYVANPAAPGCKEGAEVTNPELDALRAEQESMATAIADAIENGE